MEEFVTFAGHVSDSELENLYKETDLLMMLSRNEGSHFEGFGLVFIEAAARGIPVLGSDDSGCKEAIDEGKSGYAVNPDKPHEVAEKMKYVLEENRIHSHDCRAWAEKHDVPQQTHALEEFYNKIRS